MVGKIRSRGEKVFDGFNVVFMAVLFFIFLYPFWHVVAMSFGDIQYSTQLGLKIWPFGHTTLANYKKVLSDQSLLVGYKNTVWRTVVGTALTVLVTYLAAYAVARRDLPFKPAIAFYFIVTMFFGGGLVPNYLNIRDMGMLNTRWVWVLPGLISAYNVLIARNFILSLPYELDEAATIDGAHPMRVLFQIMMPLSMPIISVLTLWTAVGHWNAWFDAMIYTPSVDMFVLQIVLRRMLINPPDMLAAEIISVAETTQETVKMATIVVAILPIICLYPFLQKFFEKGIMIGAVKG